MSKLNVDQKTIKDLMRGANLNAEHFGTTYFHLLFPMKERQNLIVIASISSVRL